MGYFAWFKILRVANCNTHFAGLEKSIPKRLHKVDQILGLDMTVVEQDLIISLRMAMVQYEVELRLIETST